MKFIYAVFLSIIMALAACTCKAADIELTRNNMVTMKGKVTNSPVIPVIPYTCSLTPLVARYSLVCNWPI